MEKIVGDCSTLVKLTSDEAKSICNLGQGEKCCAFLVCSAQGFECLRMDYPNNDAIVSCIKKGTMRAKGTGGWKGCAWEGVGWLEYCKSCKRKHYMTYQKCPSCGVYETPQPASSNVANTCHAQYECDGCEAYREHTS